MNNNFNNMDDLFNQLMGNMGGYPFRKPSLHD